MYAQKKLILDWWQSIKFIPQVYYGPEQSPDYSSETILRWSPGASDIVEDQNNEQEVGHKS